jgi:hypothetical protein
VLDLQDREDAYDLLTAEAGDAGLLFVTTPSLMNPVLRFALENPNCLTLVYSACSTTIAAHYFGRYSRRCSFAVLPRDNTQRRDGCYVTRS